MIEYKQYKFQDIVQNKDGFLRGPFGSALKKSIFIPKGNDTYKVYEQGVVLQKNKDIGQYYISKEYFDNEMFRFEVQTRDFLVSCSGMNYGAIYQLTGDIEPGVINQALLRIRLNNELVDDNYFNYYFNAIISKKITNGTGDSTIPNFPPMSFVKNIEIELPDLPTQKKIADVLSCIDDKIALNIKTNRELENMAKTVYDYWFTQFDFPDANGNPYKTSGGKMEYNQVLKREIPAGWEVKSLDYFGEFKNGINYDPEEIGDTTVKIINVRNITESTVFFNISNFDVLTLKGKEVQKYLTDNNDIFIARSGTPGATRLLPPDVKDVVYCGFIIRYKIFDSVNKNYAFFSVKQYENQTTLQAAGTILKNVSQDTLKDIYIPVPEKEILLKFNKKIESIFNMQLKIAKENEELTKLRDYLLPLLMNGQIEVR